MIWATGTRYYKTKKRTLTLTKSNPNRFINEPFCFCKARGECELTYNLLHTTYYLLPTNYHLLRKARGECELTCAPAVGATGYRAIQAIPTATWLGVGLGLGLGYQAIQAGHALRCTRYSTKL